MKKITTLDIEASGLATDSYPIEVGVVLADGSSWCSLIKPLKEWQYWSMEAEAIHQITQKDLADHGKAIKEIANTLNELLKGQTVYGDCWVLDDRWLRKLFNAAEIAPLFTLRDIIYLLREEQFVDWEPMKQHISKELNILRHRATNDARILQETFARINAS